MARLTARGYISQGGEGRKEKGGRNGRREEGMGGGGWERERKKED
jgi:hypothetical protein